MDSCRLVSAKLLSLPPLICACVPVGVENGGGVSAEEGHQLGGTARLIDRNDGKGATAACFPVNGDVFRVGLRGYERSCWVVACEAGAADLDQVGVPCILGDADIVVALFLITC